MIERFDCGSGVYGLARRCGRGARVQPCGKMWGAVFFGSAMDDARIRT
jgi:hypothetical protein